MIGQDYIGDRVREDIYPQGDEANRKIRRRRRAGKAWRWLFIVATVSAIVILSVLLIKILNDTVGLVAQESVLPERELLLAFDESQVLAAPNILLESEDDPAIASAIADEPNSLGFIPWSAYLTQQDRLNLVSIEGQLPGAEAAGTGDYPLDRPLYIYASTSELQKKPHVAAFLAYYLQHLDEVVPDAGYFMVDAEQLAEQSAQIAEGLGLEELPAINPADFEGVINITGSSTVFPITQAMADRFIADGFRGTINVDPTGTTAGFQKFCIDNDRSIDIVNASREVLPTEFSACQANNRRLSEAVVAQDALSVVVNKVNTFVTDVSREQLEALFTTAEQWSEVDGNWPGETISRFIPSADSGTMDFFVEELFQRESLEDLEYDDLVSIYTANISKGRCRAVEREQRFYDDVLICEDPEKFAEVCASDSPPTGCTLPPREEPGLIQLIEADVIKPKVLASWNGIESVLRRDEILAEAAQKYPNAEVFFKSWLSWQFITSPQSSYPEIAGIRTAILGTLWVVGIAILISFPLGVAAAVYLEEYADKRSRFNQIIQTNINNLAGVPSIIYGLLGLAVFVRALEPITSGYIFGAVESGATANGRTILSAGLTLGLLGLPVIIISAQEAIRAVPPSLRQASFGLGATKWETVRHHVLPNAIAGILTGVILSTSRIIGETAPLVVVGASTFITTDPTGPFSKFTTLPSQIYQWTARPQDTFRDIAAATIVVLITMLLLLNATAIYFRNRWSKRLG
jgi:phosphate transport system permease protein